MYAYTHTDTHRQTDRQTDRQTHTHTHTQHTPAQNKTHTDATKGTVRSKLKNPKP